MRTAKFCALPDSIDLREPLRLYFHLIGILCPMRLAGNGGARSESLMRSCVLNSRALLATMALVAVTALAPGVVRAQDATWLLNPASSDFDTGANWNPATVPTGTAFFGTSNTTALTFSAATTTVGGWTSNTGASAYTFAAALRRSSSRAPASSSTAAAMSSPTPAGPSNSSIPARPETPPSTT